MKLRPYQIEALFAIRRHLGLHRSTLCIMPTGCGKTVLFAHLAHEWEGGDVLVLAHREELINQAANKIEAVTGFRPAIEMGDQRSEDAGFLGIHPRIVVASKDSMHPGRIRKFSPNRFGLIIIDEAHRSAKHNRTYSKVLEYFPNAKVVGVTATADRSDKASIIGTVFESVAYEYKLLDAIRDGYLVPLKQGVVTVHGLDFSEVRTLAKDFREDDLERVLTEEHVIHEMCLSTFRLAGDRPAIIFCVTKKHAEMMAAVMERYAPNQVICVTGNTPKEDRVRLIKEYHEGKYQYLFGCDIFIEGWDEERVRFVGICRPTKSRPRAIQMFGRGTRTIGMHGDTPEERRTSIAASIKPDCIIADYVGCSNDLDLMITVADIVANAVEIDCPPARREEVIKNAKTRAMEGALDMEQTIEEEAAAVRDDQERRDQEKRRIEDERRFIKANDVSYSFREVNGFDSRDQTTVGTRTFSRKRPMSDKQRDCLIAYGCDPATIADYSVADAGISIDYCKKNGRKMDWKRVHAAKKQSYSVG